METKEQLLHTYFGYTAFRVGQDRLIDAVLAGRDAFGIMPTGGGKSICYQIPALMLEGVTLVISPLISLMKDQVVSLRAAGIPAGIYQQLPFLRADPEGLRLPSRGEIQARLHRAGKGCFPRNFSGC